MKNLCSVLFALMMTLFLLPGAAWATEDNPSALTGDTVIVYQETVNLPDGSTLEIQVAEGPAITGGTIIKNGSTSCTHYSSNGSVLWTATLSASFRYDGNTSLCLSASLSTQFNSSSYYEVSRSVTKSGNTAMANFTIGYKILGITVSQTPYTLTLSCDKDGHLS